MFTLKSLLWFLGGLVVSGLLSPFAVSYLWWPLANTVPDGMLERLIQTLPFLTGAYWLLFAIIMIAMVTALLTRQAIWKAVAFGCITAAAANTWFLLGIDELVNLPAVTTVLLFATWFTISCKPLQTQH